MGNGIHFRRQGMVLAILLAGPVAAAVAAPATALPTPASANGRLELHQWIASGDECRTNGRPADALMWYRQAVRTGSMDAVHRMGELFLAGQESEEPRQSVTQNLTEGVRFTYWAATNLHPPACRSIARVYHDGLGVKTNLIQAYAWLRLFSELEPVAGRVELDQLAVQLDGPQLLEAQLLADQFKNGQWPPPPRKRAIEGDPRLVLSGLSVGARGALAVINGKTLAEGETIELTVPNGRLTVTCSEIRDQSVLLDIAGENEARLLYFR